MKCEWCGRKIDGYSRVCPYCGRKVTKENGGITVIIITVSVLFIIVAACLEHEDAVRKEQEEMYGQRNPYLESRADITDDLIYRIANDKLDSLTINYQFTACYDVRRIRLAILHLEELSKAKNNVLTGGPPERYYDVIEEDIVYANPFKLAARRYGLEAVRFPVKFGPRVHSLACAFSGTEEISRLKWIEMEVLSNITDMDRMFAYSGIEHLNAEEWDTSAVTNMRGMFKNAEAFNQPLEAWDTSSVRDMRGMFSGAKVFNQPLASWDTSLVRDMSEMFENAEAFNQPLDSWDTSSVRDVSEMFSGAKVFNQPLASWDTSAVTNMRGMFKNDEAFNQPLDPWDTSSVRDMSGMFSGTKAFNQPLASWDTSLVRDMSEMFENAEVFNQPLKTWDTSSVWDMSRMFFGAKAFSQCIDNWNMERVRLKSDMFSDDAGSNRQVPD